jgi:hypothetical protein
MKKTALFSLLTVSALLLAAPASGKDTTLSSKPTHIAGEGGVSIHVAGEGGVSMRVAEGGVSA